MADRAKAKVFLENTGKDVEFQGPAGSDRQAKEIADEDAKPGPPKKVAPGDGPHGVKEAGNGAKVARKGNGVFDAVKAGLYETAAKGNGRVAVADAIVEIMKMVNHREHHIKSSR